MEPGDSTTTTPGATTIKLITAKIYRRNKLFQPSLMFVVKAGAYPRVEHLKVPGKPSRTSLMFVCKARAYLIVTLSTNIRLC